MPDEYSRRPTLPGLRPREDLDAVWQTLHSDRARVHARFDSLEKDVKQMAGDMGEVKGSLKAMEKAEEDKAKASDKWEQRRWQIASALLIAFLLFLGAVVARVFLPVAAASVQSKPETVLEHLDKVHATLDHASHE